MKPNQLALAALRAKSIADPHLTCAHCGGEVTARTVTPERGPGFR